GRAGIHLAVGRHRRARSRVRTRHRDAGAGWHAARRPVARRPQDRVANEIGRNGRGRGLPAARPCRDHIAKRQPLYARSNLGSGREAHSRRETVSTVAEPIAPGRVVELIAKEEERFRSKRQPQWRFTNSGTESTLDAVRLARGFTGRDRLIKIEASYHGHHDALLVSVEPPSDLMGPAEAP